MPVGNGKLVKVAEAHYIDGRYEIDYFDRDEEMPYCLDALSDREWQDYRSYTEKQGYIYTSAL